MRSFLPQYFYALKIKTQKNKKSKKGNNKFEGGKMKRTRRIFIIAFLLCIYTYCCKVDSIPNNIILYGGEQLNIGNFAGISLKIGDKDCDTVLASSEISSLSDSKNKEATVDVKLFNTFNVKEVSVSIIDKTTVVPVGQVSGLKLYTNGVLVVGMSEIKGIDNQKYKPYENSGIEEGDRITKINNEEVTDTNTLINIVNKSKGENLEIEYVRNNEMKYCNITPIKYGDGSYKLGLWVRDSAAGIGTLTFYEPSTGNFAALGHGITDTDTGKLVEIQNGEFLTTKILSIIKGIKRKSG
jgi:stage IV sporulation protein B